MPYLLIAVCVVFAIFFYRAAELEDESGWIWCSLSIVISAVTVFFFHWGWLGYFLGQIGLFVGITIFRMLRKS